jgi:hypothetical protein
LLRTDIEAQRNASKARSPETAVHMLSSRRRGDSENSPSRNGLETSAARRELGFIITDIGQQQWVLHRHAAGFFDELDKLLDSERFLIGAARAASRRETVRRGQGLNQSQLLGIGRRRGSENDRRRKRESGKEAGADGGHGGLLILALKLSVGRVSPFGKFVAANNDVIFQTSG